jgi:hypothetical protein
MPLDTFWKANAAVVVILSYIPALTSLTTMTSLAVLLLFSTELKPIIPSLPLLLHTRRVRFAISPVVPLIVVFVRQRGCVRVALLTTILMATLVKHVVNLMLTVLPVILQVLVPVVMLATMLMPVLALLASLKLPTVPAVMVPLEFVALALLVTP